jgi:hypothetical protein
MTKYVTKVCMNKKCKDCFEINGTKWTQGFKYCPICGLRLFRRVVEPVTVRIIKPRVQRKTTCFYCGDYVDGSAHKELCLSWKEDIKRAKEAKKVNKK